MQYTDCIAYLPYFGDVVRFRPHLKRVVQEIKQHCPGLDVRVLTDDVTDVQLQDQTDIPPMQVCRFRPDPELIREDNTAGKNFDRKAALVVALLESAPDHRPMVLDIDNFIRRDFASVLQDIPANTVVAMPPSPQEPYSKLIGGRLPEHTSSFMIFGGGEDGRRAADQFRRVVSMAKSTPEGSHYLREQRSWSVVWHVFHAINLAHLLPQTMGWSRFWSEQEPAGTFIRHKHGKEKWV